MRFTDLMRRLLAVLALVAVAGCGRGGEARLASDGSPTPAPAAVTTTPVAPTAEPTVEASAATVTPQPRPRPSTTELPASLPPTPSPAPPPHGDPLVLTNNDSGRTISVASGTQIQVRLQPELGNYDHPTTSDPSVVERHAVRGGYPSNDPSEGVFEAATPGSADLSATTDAQCLHQQPSCMIPQKQWVVHIVVRR